jgi:hypothetical protein
MSGGHDGLLVLPNPPPTNDTTNNTNKDRTKPKLSAAKGSTPTNNN